MEPSAENHSTLLMQKIQKLYEEGGLLDMTLLCQGQAFPAHSLILAAFSSHLKVLLTQSESFCQEISLDDLRISSQNLQSLLNFMYTGILCEVEDVESLATSATKLGVDEVVVLLQKQKVDQVSQQETTVSPGNDIAKKVKAEPVDDFTQPVLDTLQDISMRLSQQSSTSSQNSNTGTLPLVEDELPDLLDFQEKAIKKEGMVSANVKCKSPGPAKRGRGRPRKVCEETKVSSIESSDKVQTRQDKKSSLESPAKSEVSLDSLIAAIQGEDQNSWSQKSNGELNKSNDMSIDHSSPVYGTPPSNKEQKSPVTSKSPDARKSRRLKGMVHCQRCDYKTKTNKAFYNHFILKHTEGKTHHCPHCSKTFKLRKYLVTHLVSHSESRPFACDKCDAKFKLAKHLTRHLQTHEREGIKCLICHSVFRTEMSLKKHQRREHPVEGGRTSWPCPQEGCSYTGNTQAALNAHHFRKHSGMALKNILCEVCGKNFRTKQSLKIHKLLHFGQDIKCQQCDYSSKNKNILNSHMMRRHGVSLDGRKARHRKTCDICGVGCFTLAEYKLHMLKHEGLKPHKCPICNYATVDKGSLKKHIRAHTGETPFKCRQCGKAFTQQSGYARHRRIHLGIKPHKCTTCGKSYADKKTLNNHIFTHTTIKPLLCHICNYNCTKRESLRKHIKQQHGVAAVPQNLLPKKAAVIKTMQNFYVERVVEVETEEPDVKIEDVLHTLGQQSLVVDSAALNGEMDSKSNVPFVVLLPSEQDNGGQTEMNS